MHTRTSPRNQQILFNELFRPVATQRVDVRSVESLERQLSMVTNARTRRMIEREIASAKHREAVKRALTHA